MPNSRKSNSLNLPAGASVLILAILLCTAPAFPQEERPEGTAGRPPVGRWYTLKSDNFLIHFTEGSEHLARRVADIAEDVHAKLSVEIKSKPSGRTHIMLRDWYDSVNGWASPLPRNTIAVYPVGPGLSELELTFTDDWLRLLITHEYVHILTMDMAGGVPGLFRKIFGRSMATVPNAFMPLWIIEGYAVYHETKHTRGGRARGPYFDMILRAASLDGKFNTISQAQSGIDSWPSAIQYIYGGMFCQYLADRFGEDRLLEIYRRQSRVIGPVLPWVPGQFESLAVSLYWLTIDPVGENGFGIFNGLHYDRLWDDWKNSLRAGYEEQKARLEKDGLTASTRLTHTGYRTAEPEFSPDGRQIAYISRGDDRYTQLRLMDADGHNDRLLYQGRVESLCWSPDGEKIVFAMLDYWRGLFFYSDLYVCDTGTGKVERLTRGLRVRTPAWSPDGKAVLFAVNTGSGNSDLAVLNLEAGGKSVRYFTRSRDMSFYSGCAWSPDGLKIAFVKLEPGRLQKVCMANPDGTGVQEITEGRAQDLAPSWSPDGKHLLFTSGRTGIYNIFAYSFETKKTVQLTSVLGGALSPSMSADGKTLAFAAYSSAGWDIHTAEVDMEKARAAGPFEDLLPDMKYETQAGDYSVRPYSALGTLAPTAWTPVLSYTGEFGAMAAGMDVLEKHFYVLELGYNPFIYRPVMGVHYSYEGSKYRALPLTASAEAYRRPVLYGGLMEDADGEDVAYWEDQKLLSVSLGALVWRTTETEAELSAGYEYRSFDRISHLEPGGTFPGTGVLSSVFVSGRFDDSKLYPLGISATDGRKVELTAKSAGPTLGSDYRIDSLSLRWSEYVSAPWKSHHVVMGRVAGGISDGDVIDKRSFFHVGGMGELLPVSDIESIPLRGYRDNEILGTHALVATLEYRFPLWLMEGGSATRPIFFRKLSGYFFVDSGNAWSGPMYLRVFRTGAGLGLRLTTDFFYRKLDGYALDMGFAYGFDRGGVSQLYFTVTFLW